MKELTEFECLQEAGKLYNGILTIDKAIKFLNFEYNWDIKIVEDKSININSIACEKYDVTKDEMEFMKKLQESGEVNMFSSIDIITKRLLVTDKIAKHILSVYIKHYDEIYYPQRLI